MRRTAVTAPQLSLFIIAAGVAGILLAKALVSSMSLPTADVPYLARLSWFVLGGFAIFSIGRLRLRTRELLSVPVPHSRLAEVVVVAIAVVLLQFALFGYLAMDRWMRGGNVAVMQIMLVEERNLDHAFDATTLRDLAITSLLAPVIEEIVFRGLLFEQWAQTRRPAVAMVLSSIVFAACHLSYAFPFGAGLLLCAVYVRTGALRAAIFVHFVGNASMWYPLLGRFVVPADSRGIESYWFHLLCLGLVPLFIGFYAFAAQRARAAGVANRPIVAAPA
jgi:membrane protease YdiL (CAAX protease family)